MQFQSEQKQIGRIPAYDVQELGGRIAPGSHNDVCGNVFAPLRRGEPLRPSPAGRYVQDRDTAMACGGHGAAQCQQRPQLVLRPDGGDYVVPVVLFVLQRSRLLAPKILEAPRAFLC